MGNCCWTEILSKNCLNIFPWLLLALDQNAVVIFQGNWLAIFQFSWVMFHPHNKLWLITRNCGHWHRFFCVCIILLQYTYKYISKFVIKKKLNKILDSDKEQKVSNKIFTFILLYCYCWQFWLLAHCLHRSIKIN